MKDSVGEINFYFFFYFLCFCDFEAVKRYKNKRDFHSQQKGTILKHINQRTTERVNKNESGDNSEIYYMPHPEVMLEDLKTSNMRIVIDVSSSEVNFSFFNNSLKLISRYSNTSFAAPSK